MPFGLEDKFGVSRLLNRSLLIPGPLSVIEMQITFSSEDEHDVSILPVDLSLSLSASILFVSKLSNTC